jgi:hypothetical protein
VPRRSAPKIHARTTRLWQPEGGERRRNDPSSGLELLQLSIKKQIDRDISSKNGRIHCGSGRPILKNRGLFGD